MNDTEFAPVEGAPIADERTDRIVSAALAEFSENGFAASRLTSVARRTGISKPTLLRYFASKDEIFREVVRTTLIGCMTQLHDGGLPHSNGASVTAVDQVRAFAKAYWHVMERPELTEVLRLAIGELHRFPELAVFYVTETLERSFRTIERIIAGGIARGELRPHDARASARTVLSAITAHALWFARPDIYGGLIGHDRERAAAATIESLVEALVPVRGDATSPTA
jgi:AcrR family transcriptional regulator